MLFRNVNVRLYRRAKNPFKSGPRLPRGGLCSDPFLSIDLTDVKTEWSNISHRIDISHATWKDQMTLRANHYLDYHRCPFFAFSLQSTTNSPNTRVCNKFTVSLRELALDVLVA